MYKHEDYKCHSYVCPQYLIEMYEQTMTVCYALQYYVLLYLI